MTSSNLSEGDRSKHVPVDSLESDESNVSGLSILDELGNSVASDTSAALQLRFQRLLAESALENSAAQKNEEYETLFEKCFYEDFVPAEALDKLMADEIAWKKEFGHTLPVNEKLELSCFSGIMGVGDISVRSSVVGEMEKKNKISAEEYFSLKRYNVEDFNTALGIKERVFFENDVKIVTVHIKKTPETLVQNPKLSNLSS